MPKISVLVQYLCFVIFAALIIQIVFLGRPIGLLEALTLPATVVVGVFAWAFEGTTSKKGEK